ncbi:p53 and DNA damage-regulated protein 1 [Toxorhynchites rutilus septentrionalis]|uniref:p53 and DNA damage-regulated protein 1 n=1 Tax=Toxorhynchites rutilus septentrionalis TaxID=329112 RepID=UPI00247985BC|nr:p53 and DNA damage-regulated protein 1 [Toxorhynchites rutilus septentrionalis]
MPISNEQKTIEILRATERVADQVLMLKQELIALDKRRQETREAVRTIRNSFPRDDAKVWITVGSMLMKMNKAKALELLAKDAEHIEQEIKKIRTEQKVLVSKQRDLEHDSPLRGFDLKPLSAAEISAIKANVPGF